MHEQHISPRKNIMIWFARLYVYNKQQQTDKHDDKWTALSLALQPIN